MLNAVLLCALAAPAETAQVRFFYVAKKGDDFTITTEAKELEPWILKQAPAKDKAIIALSDWKTLTGKMNRIYSTNGAYLDGKVKTHDKKHEIEIDGCFGFGVQQKLLVETGAKKVFALKDYPGFFAAIRSSGD